MVVDDSSDQRILVGRGLELAGHQVKLAANGQEAISALQALTPDLVLTDLRLPDMDGFELMRRIRAIESLAAVPVVAVTGWAEPEVERKVRDAGFAGYVLKPVDLSALKRMVQQYG